MGSMTPEREAKIRAAWKRDGRKARFTNECPVWSIILDAPRPLGFYLDADPEVLMAETYEVGRFERQKLLSHDGERVFRIVCDGIIVDEASAL